MYEKKKGMADTIPPVMNKQSPNAVELANFFYLISTKYIASRKIITCTSKI